MRYRTKQTLKFLFSCVAAWVLCILGIVVIFAQPDAATAIAVVGWCAFCVWLQDKLEKGD